MRSYYIEVPKKKGEFYRQLLKEKGNLNLKVKIRVEKDIIGLPIYQKKGIPERFQALTGDFEPLVKRPDFSETLGYHPKYEVIGDIAVVEDPHPEQVAELLLSFKKNIKTVITPVSNVTGEFRVKSYQHVAGEQRTRTIYRENGLRYLIDLEKVFVNPRLATERERIINSVSKDEVVVDMFSGFGPFTIPIAKRVKKVYAADKNLKAVEFLKENLKINRVKNVETFVCDALDLKAHLKELADRVIMNNPLFAATFLDVAKDISKKDGMIHYYDTIDKTKNLETLVLDVEAKGFEISETQLVKSMAPNTYIVRLNLSKIDNTKQ